MGIEGHEGDKFPHENKGENHEDFIANLFAGSSYQKAKTEELCAYLKQFGISAAPANK